jgi:hypothetical protein
MKALDVGHLVWPVLLFTCFGYAQSDQDYELACRSETARRLNLNRIDVGTQMQGVTEGRARVAWRADLQNDKRNGYCLIDRNMNVVEFRDFSSGGSDYRNDRDYDRDRERPLAVYPQVKVDTSGRGNFSGDQTVRITRGWVDTKGEPTVALSGEDDFKISFRGDVIRSNGDREYTIRIRSSDRGDAEGIATFRLNKDKNEVEFINVGGRLNGRNFTGSFNR